MAHHRRLLFVASASVALDFAVLFLAACECIPETDEELCSRQSCGLFDMMDSCGQWRRVDCGQCEITEVAPEEVEPEAEAPEVEPEEEVLPEVEPEVEVPEEVLPDVEVPPPVERDETLRAFVRDGLTDEVVEDATVGVYLWPPTGGEENSWVWSDGAAPGAVDHSFDGLGPICIDDEQWYRIVVDAPGYERGIFYRNHQRLDGNNPCPDECGNCLRGDLLIWPSDQPYPQYPTFVVDVRELQEHRWQCARIPSDSGSITHLIGLRLRVGAANVGTGPASLQGVIGDDPDETEVVYQHIRWSDGRVEKRPIDGGYEFHHAHNHVHFLSWIRMALVRPDEECQDVTSRPASCVSHQVDKVSYCLYDLNQFDEEVQTLYGETSPQFTDPPTCDSYHQGLTAGWRDTYGVHLPGQVIITGSPAETATLGSRWIEAEVDPQRVLHEGERANNVGRITVETPTDVEGLCDDPETLLDCTGNPAEFDFYQRWQCDDYIEYPSAP